MNLPDDVNRPTNEPRDRFSNNDKQRGSNPGCLIGRLAPSELKNIRAIAGIVVVKDVT
ncbi:MAG: hypothetical protein Rhob2KO_46430 [Rhodopirellula baltica]